MSAHPELLQRITARPEVFGGKPIVRDLRISVELVLGLLCQGVTQEELLDDYPELELDDIRACIAPQCASIVPFPFGELELDDIRACIAYARAGIAGDALSAVSVAAR